MKSTPLNMNLLKFGLLAMFISIFGNSCNETVKLNQKTLPFADLMIRITEIEIDSVYLDEYMDILKVEAAASVIVEPAVLCIFPMFQKENPNEIRLLEIYASKEAYESHLQTPHFKHYKTATQHMVKSLHLVDMEAIDQETMSSIFIKLKQY